MNSDFVKSNAHIEYGKRGTEPGIKRSAVGRRGGRSPKRKLATIENDGPTGDLTMLSKSNRKKSIVTTKHDNNIELDARLHVCEIVAA